MGTIDDILLTRIVDIGKIKLWAGKVRLSIDESNENIRFKLGRRRYNGSDLLLGEENHIIDVGIFDNRYFLAIDGKRHVRYFIKDDDVDKIKKYFY